jgi:hypothetical protein
MLPKIKVMSVSDQVTVQFAIDHKNYEYEYEFVIDERAPSVLGKSGFMLLKNS